MVIVGRKYAKYLTDAKGVQKVRSALIRQGYGYDDITSVLETYTADLPDERPKIPKIGE